MDYQVASSSLLELLIRATAILTTTQVLTGGACRPRTTASTPAATVVACYLGPADVRVKRLAGNICCRHEDLLAGVPERPGKAPQEQAALRAVQQGGRHIAARGPFR